MARNVLVIMADEHQARALGCAGHPVVQTPALDSLARRGTRFEHCWSPSPICVPGRASFATGRFVHEIGAWDSAQAYAGEPEGWAHTMRDRGHDVVSFGKLHHRSTADDDGFTERHLPMNIVGGVGWLQGLPRRDPFPYNEAAELAADVGVGETTYTRYDRRVAAAACDWLGAPDRPETPWVAFVSFVAPHYPLSAPEEFAARYPIDDIPPPEIEAIEPTNPAVRFMADYFAYDRYFDADLTTAARAAYFGLCSFVDHHVGEVLAALDASGQRDDTLVVYTSDHGELLGNRGLWCKSFLYEDSVAVPMILAGPGVPAGSTVSTNVNLVDVAPTITGDGDGAGFARSLVELANEPTHDRLAFSEYHDGGSITGSFAIRSGEWKYVHHQDFPPELYDLESDPDERHDRSTDPRARAELDRCARVLDDLVDTAGANDRAFASQLELIEANGGRNALTTAFRFNHTPVPDA